VASRSDAAGTAKSARASCRRGVVTSGCPPVPYAAIQHNFSVPTARQARFLIEIWVLSTRSRQLDGRHCVDFNHTRIRWLID